MAILPAAFTHRRKHLTTMIKKHADLARVEKRRGLKVRHVVECGKALTELKELLQHGGWKQWLEEECDVNRMTANRYIRLANRKHQLTPNMTIRKAYIAAGVIKAKRPSRSKRPRPSSR